MNASAIISRYRAGASVRQIGREAGIAHSVVWRALEQAGEPRRGRGSPRRPATAETAARDAQVVRAYRSGASLDAIGRALGISKSCAWNILVRHHEPRRSR
jgi:transposase-like protein